MCANAVFAFNAGTSGQESDKVVPVRYYTATSGNRKLEKDIT